MEDVICGYKGIVIWNPPVINCPYIPEGLRSEPRIKCCKPETEICNFSMLGVCTLNCVTCEHADG